MVVVSKSRMIKTTDIRNPRGGFEFVSQIGIIQNPELNEMELNKDYSFVNNCHRGKDIIVIGSGYSGRGVDREALRDCITIGVNHTIEWFEPKYLLFQDHRFLRLNKYPLDTFPGTIFTANTNPFRVKSKHPRIVTFRPLHGKNPSVNIQKGLFSRVSSGVCALNLALIMGARKVFMIGCDTPKDYDKWDYSKGAHIVQDYRGGIETKEQVEKYLSILPLYKSFQPYSNRIVNVCENGSIPYFQQMKMSDFNSLINKK